MNIAAPATTESTRPALRQVRTRRISFEYPPDRLTKHFMRDDLIMNHIVATLSAMFPNGEDFFVRSVRNYRDEITDPELRKQVGGFIGQEAMHGREHRTLNARLHELGYPTNEVDWIVLWLFKVADKVLPKSTRLAITAALEHYTATLAEILMADEQARAMFASDEVRNLLLWHALEESEHKAVAFDVYQEVCGNQLRRIIVMNAVNVGFLSFATAYTIRSLVGDRDTYRPRKLLPSLRKLWSSPWGTPAVARRILDYNRRDFHPDDHDNTVLLEHWRTELFGDDGALSDHLKNAGGDTSAA